jgi:phage tail protein X
MDYLTRQNDILDDVVYRYYGDTDNRIVETVLESNRGLADYGPVLPAGVIIVLPDRVASQEAEKLQTLWD